MRRYAEESSGEFRVFFDDLGFWIEVRSLYLGLRSIRLVLICSSEVLISELGI